MDKYHFAATALRTGSCHRCWKTIVAFLFPLLWFTGGAAADLGWRNYTDSGLGYSVIYPVALFEGAPVREHGGITLASSTGARLYIFGGPNATGRSPDTVAAQLAGSEDVARVTYRRLTRDWLVLSGYVAGEPGEFRGSIFYERIAFSPDGRTLAGFRLVYPRNQRALFDPVIATIGRSLRAPRPERLAAAGVREPEASAMSESLAVPHREWCQRNYSTYDPSTDSFLSFDGMRVACVSPAD